MDGGAHPGGPDGFVATKEAHLACAPADALCPLSPDRAFDGAAATAGYGIAVAGERPVPRPSRTDPQLPSARRTRPERARTQRAPGVFLMPNGSSADGLMRDFSVTMLNRLRFSTCESPWRPITRARQELLAVAFRNDVLTLTELKTDGSFGSRIYAQRSVALPGAMTFLMLRQLPSRLRDDAFFPASGTAVVFAPADGSPRRLSAVGTDLNSGLCRGWLFDAIETAA